MEFDTVADVPSDDEWVLVTGRHEVAHVLDSVGVDADDYSHGSVFARVGDGEYTDVLFFSGCVPYLHKPVTRLV